MPTGAARERVWLALGASALLSLVALFALAPIFAVDFFWHLKLGQLIAEQRAIPRLDMFSAVHPQRPYVQFQWLWELTVYGAYQLGGLLGVRLFQVCTLVLSFVALLAVSLRLFGSRAFAFCYCALALVLFEDRFQTRPSATALGFVALSLPLLILPRLRDRRGAFWLTLGLGSLWSNIHGGESLLWPLCLAALTVGNAVSFRLASASPQRLVRDAQLLGAACLGVLLSPAFVAGLSDWTRTIGPQLSSGNKEWRPSYTMLENGLSPSHLLIALGPSLIMLMYGLEQRRRVRGRPLASAPWAEWLLCAGLLVLSQQAVRNAFLCLVPLCFMLCRLPQLVPARTQRLVAALGAVLLLVAAHDHLIQGYGGLAEAREILPEDLSPSAFPEELTAFMREAHIEGGMINDGRWGGYLIWQLWPACHVFVDTRQDLTADMWPVFLDSQHPDTRPAALETAFARWQVELAVFRGPTFPLILPPPDWQLLYKAGDQELYQHRAGGHAELNRARTHAWLLHKLGSAAAGRADRELATELGAQTWLAAPDRRRLRRKADALLRSSYGEDVEAGLLLDSQLAFDAGDYGAARAPLERVLSRHPDTLKALYRYALASFAVSDHVRARWALDRLLGQREGLSAVQRGRLSVLDRTLALRGLPSAGGR